MKKFFSKFSASVSVAAGSPFTFILAVLIITFWAFSGRYFEYSDTWQLVINTGTTIVTFLMVFLIQNTQNRESKALHIKLDELLRAQKGARTSLVDIEEMEDEELESLYTEFKELHDKLSHQMAKRGRSTATNSSKAE